jgi:diguanylate cyclase (GGDEF)-like protein
MHLDLATLMAMGAFVFASAGAVLLVAWSQDRKNSVLMLWGMADILAAGGVVSLLLGHALSAPLWSIFGGNLLMLSQGLVWKAARTFDAKPAPLLLAFAGVGVAAVASSVPGMQDFVGSLGLLVSAGYLFAAAGALWLGRKERLPARRPIIVFTTVHAVILLVGAYTSFGGSTGQDQIAPLMSLFGLIHFESIIFALGNAAFVLALAKERSVAASRIAASTDPLTGILNRVAFMERAGQIVERSRSDSAPVAVMMFDLDRFKVVNDTHGHSVGDAVIRKFCEVTASALRAKDVFGRLGGEEFAVLVSGSGIEAAGVRAERIRASFAENCRSIEGRPVNTTVSVGVSAGMIAGQTLGDLLERSDAALYVAKAQGRNRVHRASQPGPDGGPSTLIRVA